MRFVLVLVAVVGLLVALGRGIGGSPVTFGGGGESSCEATLDHVRDLYRAEVRAREDAESYLSSCQSELSSCESDLSDYE